MAQDLAPAERIAESLFLYEIHIAAKYFPKLFNHFNERRQKSRILLYGISIFVRPEATSKYWDNKSEESTCFTNSLKEIILKKHLYR